MGVSRGKEFENEIRKALEGQNGISIDRNPDPMAGYAGVRNICDFTIYHYPSLIYLECKETGGNTLNFKSAITTNQWDGLIDKSIIYGVIGGYAVWFLNHDKTYFVPALELYRAKNLGAKSLHINDILNNDVYAHEIIGRKKRVMFAYKSEDILYAIQRFRNESWAMGRSGRDDGFKAYEQYRAKLRN